MVRRHGRAAARFPWRHERRSGVFDQFGQAHMRGLVTSRPLLVAGLACAGARAALAGEVLPALAETGLCAPSDLDDPGILAGLARREHRAHARPVAVVRSLNQQPARERRAGLGDPAGRAHAFPEVYSDGTTPRNPDSRRVLLSRRFAQWWPDVWSKASLDCTRLSAANGDLSTSGADESIRCSRGRRVFTSLREHAFLLS